MAVDDLRLHLRNEAEVRPDGDLVLYWMTAARRLRWNPALERAARHARDLDRPLLVLDDLRSGHRWDTDRHHRFVLDGMAEKRAWLADGPATYYPHVERQRGQADGLVEALADRAAVVVTDVYPCDVWPGIVKRLAGRLPVRLEAVDGCGLLPLVAGEKVYTTAFSFRALLQKALRPHLERMPKHNPLARVTLRRLGDLPEDIKTRWPPADEGLFAGEGLSDLPIDHAVPPVEAKGGEAAARRRLKRFVDERLTRYADGARHPDDRATSELSPYLRHGFISAHEVFHEVAKTQDGWTPEAMDASAGGSRGWWGMDENAEAFLDELVTWREIGANRCALTDDYDRYASLPRWARETLKAHADDARPETYTRDELDAGATGDRLWNAAQTQLRRDGVIHNYMRMLWGKKVLAWTSSPEEALETLLDFNNRYGIDGRDPNSYSGVFWCFGRYDRAWGPERPVFGKVRYMTSDSTARKLHLDEYLATYDPEG